MIDSGVLVNENVRNIFNNIQYKNKKDIDTEYVLENSKFTCKTSDGEDISKLIFIFWAPDTSKVKQQMLYAGSKDALRNRLVGVNLEIQATDYSELDLSNSSGKLGANCVLNANIKALFPTNECRYAFLSSSYIILMKIDDSNKEIIIDKVIKLT